MAINNKTLKCCLQFCAMGLMSAALFTANTASGLSLVEDGKAVATIVIPEPNDSDPHDKWWILGMPLGYLKDYVRKATGAELKVVTEGQPLPDGALISVGHTNLAREAGITTDDLKLDSCKLIVKDRTLFLIGRDGIVNKPYTPRGTTRAVVTFLETYLGVRWLIPSWDTDFPEGEFVPQTTALAVPDDLQRTVVSKFAYVYKETEPYFNPSSPAYVANNSNTSIKIWTVGGHSWDVWVPVEKYFKDHPEYFALIDGKRSDNALNHLCPSNPEVRNIMLREIRKLFDEGYDWVQLGQSDGVSYRNVCQCEECEKLDTFSEMGKSNFPLAKLKEHPCERILLAHKWIVDECRKSHPDKTVHLLVYQPTRMPSKIFDTFGDNVIAENAIGNFKMFKYVNEAWKGKVRGFTAYIYWETTRIKPLGILTKLTPSSAADQIRYFHENNVVGIYYCGGRFGRNWGLWGPVYYTLSRLMGDPDRDPDAMVSEYCEGVYGETGDIMKSFFDLLYNRMDGIQVNQDKIAMKDHFLAYYPPWVIWELEQLLVKAEQTATTSKSKHWLKFTRDYFDYMKTVSNMFASEKNYQANPNRANLLMVKESVDAFEDYRTRIIAYSSEMKYNDRNRPGYTLLNQYLMSDYNKLHTENVRGTPAALGWIVEPLNWDFDKLLAATP